MTTADQTFFAAYGTTVTSEVAAPKARAPKPTARPADRPRTEPAAEPRNSGAAWYRADSQHVEVNKAPAPHVPQVIRKKRALPTDSVSVDIGTWSVSDAWQSSSLVIAAAMPSDPAKGAEPVVKTESQVASPRTVNSPAKPKSVDRAAPQEEPAKDKPAEESQEPWRAQWEVDGFDWPDELIRLRDEQTEYFRYAGEKLRDASREGLKTLAVVSTREQEGCTTMAICLALAAAAAGARVALLDANLGHPELGPKLGLDFSNGWQDAVTGKGELADAAVLALDSGLTLLPLAASHKLTSLNDPRISQLLRDTAAAFDLLIIDAGAIPANDGALFAGAADCPVNAALVVRDLRRTSEAETLGTASRVKSRGVDAIGIAENFLPLPGSQVAAA